MRCQIKRFPTVPDQLARGLLDTSVIVDLDRLDASQLPEEVAISAVTLAELAAGPSATMDVAERARRQDRLQRIEATFDPDAVRHSIGSGLWPNTRGSRRAGPSAQA
jgi:predicted nucleic acid-binding protein